MNSSDDVASLLWAAGDVFADEVAAAEASSAPPSPPLLTLGVSLSFVFPPNIVVLVPPIPHHTGLAAKVWRASLLLAATLLAPLPPLPFPPPPLIDCHVLELGCGRGLPGLAVAAAGARVVLSDCDDRALRVLRDLKADRVVVRNFLWERDVPGNESARHWSDAYRAEEGGEVVPLLEPDATFDLILASDCLYFSSQEVPLAHVLLRRLRRPHGKALLIVQCRGGDGGFELQWERLKALLQEGGLAVGEERGPWPWDALQRHVLPSPDGDGEDVQLCRTIMELGDPLLVTVTWKAS